MKKYIYLLLLLGSVCRAFPQTTTGTLAPKPVYRDPVFDGAADPTLIWNRTTKKWNMFYTNRRATDTTEAGVSWVHGTEIGIAESTDGANWKYTGIAKIDYKPDSGYTYWAPEIVEYKGLYHMYLTYVPGVFGDWHHPRNIIHLTSKNLTNWKFESTLHLVNDHVIDPCVIQLPDGTWRMWYNNETDHKSTYYADSPDLYHWTNGNKAIFDQPGEGPKAFRWQNKYWMITDVWAGLAVYSSDDLKNWVRQAGGNILADAGKGTDDGVKGGHCDVRVSKNGRAYLYYFVHPGIKNAGGSRFQKQRSSIQVVELKYLDGKIVCDRDSPTFVDLKPQRL